MIHYLKLKNFGPIKNEAEISFEGVDNLEDDYEITMGDGRKLLKLAYVYGANASGKTTILKAFDFLRKILLKPVTDKSQELPFDPFLFCDDAYAIPSSFELSFYIGDIRYVYTVNLTKFSILEERLIFYQTARPSEIFSRQTDSVKRLTKIQFGTKIRVPAREKDLLESNTLHNNTVLGAYAKTNVDIPVLEELNKWSSAYLLGMVTSAHDLTEITAKLIDKNPKINDWINTLLNKADNQIAKVLVPEWNDMIKVPIDDAFDYEFQEAILNKENSSISTLTGFLQEEKVSPLNFYDGPRERRIEFLHKMSDGQIFPLSIQKESSGTKRYFGLSGLLFELINGSHILCVDELDNSLHPDLMKHFLQVFLMNSERSQLLITTHNLSMMADTDFIRRDALWFSEKNEDGTVSFYAASDFETAILRKDASLINAYRMGKLGAKPNLGSPYLSLIN